MAKTKVRLDFSTQLDGTLSFARGKARVGKFGDGMAPYDMLLGALGGCYYATFLDIAQKMRLEYESASIDITGVKREEVPTTLKTVTMVFTIKGAKDEKGFARAAELAGKYCSVHETIKQVADITLETVFVA